MREWARFFAAARPHKSLPPPASAALAQAPRGLTAYTLLVAISRPGGGAARRHKLEHDDPSLATLRLAPAAQQQVEFLVAPDERSHPRAQGLEAAHNAAFAQHP